MDLSNLQYRLRAPNRAITSEEAVDTVQETVRQLAKATKDRRLVPAAARDRALRAVRCRYTEEFRREVSQIRNTKEIVGINCKRSGEI